ncbi:hypothetical protein HPB51_007269 [Rhipicephalus microplus]|uniref:HTH psq-type domain-containing protein n=1 Tax=Rhipicephalus microplus TaxID=6941 RepID=A0A9J6EZI8_RHIMP|nr:hypothetical protein HPB51_007269 [Rhipicephalus microplus]
MDKGSPMSLASRAPMKRGKYVTMSMAKKAAIIKLVDSGRSQADVVKEFHISRQTISDYIKNKQKIWRRRESLLNVVRRMSAKAPTLSSRRPFLFGRSQQWPARFPAPKPPQTQS